MLGHPRKRTWRHKALGKAQQNGSMSDQPRLLAILDLILNASPAPDRQTRSNRHRRSLKLWTSILSSVPESDVYALKRSSRRWPAAVRARFDHAWSLHERDTLRWRTDSSCWPVQDLSTAQPGLGLLGCSQIMDQHGSQNWIGSTLWVQPVQARCFDGR